MRALFFALAMLLIPTSALAEPAYCLATPYGKNCWYYDLESCQRAAANSGNACVLNQDEMQKRQQQQSQPFGGSSSVPSGAPYCVVTPYANQCWYYNADQCRQAAERARGTCVYNR